jgi:hypothetical protein
LPRSVVMNVLFSAKFLATLALWATGMYMLSAVRQSAASERIVPCVSGRE